MTRWLAGLACAATVLGSACGDDTEEGRRHASGYVEATEVRASSRIGGRLEDVLVDEGTRVEQGDLVARLSTGDIDLAVARARAEGDRATAQVRLLRAGATPEEIAQADAQLAAADADHRGAQTELAAATADAARFEQLLADRAGSVKQRDDAVARQQLAEARVKAAADRAAAARAALARVQAGARAEEIDAAQAAVAAAQATIATLERDRAEAAIAAPVSGIVTSRLAEPGELIAPGAPVAVIVDLDRAWVNAYVEEPVVPTLRLDAPASVVTDAGDRLAGRIAFIAPRAEFTPRNVQTSAERARLVYRVRVAVDNTAGILKPGMPVEVDFGAP